jgi:hypothetical protein
MTHLYLYEIKLLNYLFLFDPPLPPRGVVNTQGVAMELKKKYWDKNMRKYGLLFSEVIFVVRTKIHLF